MKEITVDDLARMIAKGFSAVDERFDRLEARMDRFEGRMDGFEKRTDALEVSHDRRLRILEKHVFGLKSV